MRPPVYSYTDLEPRPFLEKVLVSMMWIGALALGIVWWTLTLWGFWLLLVWMVNA